MKLPFSPPPGLVSDETTFATPGLWADGSNVRFWRGKPQTIGGWASAHSVALTGTCRTVLPWADNEAGINIAFGTHSALQVLTGGTLYTITPAGLTAGSVDGAGGPGFGTGSYGSGTYGTSTTNEWYARTWSFATYGEYLMASPRGHTLYVWQNNTASLATEVTQAPDVINTILVTPERQVLAFGCNEEVSTTYNPMCIRGSDIEDYTDWTTTASNNAFEHILEGGGGRIVGAKMLGSYVAVWTDTSFHLGQFIGDPGQTYRFDLVANNCGLLGPNAVSVVNGVAYWMTPDLIPYRFQIGALPQALPCPIARDFTDNMVITQGEKLVASSVGKFGEVWFHYPDARDGLENSRYIAFNTTDGTWFKGVMARTAAADAGPTQYPVMITSAGAIYWHENGKSANGGVLTWSLTSADTYLNDASNWVTLRGVWPDFEAQEGAINVTLTLRKWPQDASPITKGPYSLTLNKSKKDFMASGRVVALTFDGSSSPAFVRFGKPTFDAVVAGQQ